MNDMLLLSNYSNYIPPETVKCVFNHPIVMSCLIWALAILVLGSLLYCYFKNKVKMKYEEAEKLRLHEKDLKEMTFEQEKYWHFQKNLEIDFEKELNNKIAELSRQLDAEKKDRKETLEKERLKAEYDFYKKIVETFYTEEKK